MKVGDYVRTKYGVIGKITQIIDFNKENQRHYLNYRNMLVLTNDENNDVAGSRGEIIKSSPNVIDLIEVGDILSFEDGSICRILEKSDNYYLLKDYGGEQYYEREEYIKDLVSILTKEQFESMEYKIGE